MFLCILVEHTFLNFLKDNAVKHIFVVAYTCHT